MGYGEDLRNLLKGLSGNLSNVALQENEMTQDIGFDYEKCHRCNQYINVNETSHVIARVQGEKLFFHFEHCFRHYVQFYAESNVEVLETVRML